MSLTGKVGIVFGVANKRSIAWAVHPGAKQLKAALDLFIQERALVAHADRTWTGDMADVKKHRVLRVLTRNNAVSYFLLRGEAAGFDHDLMKRFADQLDVVLVVEYLVGGQCQLAAQEHFDLGHLA